ncbi:SDR family oxidoreductase [Streptomyces sp. NPDC094034]|uniref:SDR family NAD(P)-dependent oxidoreductase n=1 Tax=Streptomyces sp. NPDC094034 TaxID=3155309 RepID=UPI00332A79B3
MTASDWLGLAGQTCVVTGAAGGIGRETCLELVRHGARVAALDLHADGLQGTVAAARELGGEARAVVCDISDADAVTAAEVTVREALGPCDVLVNNAGLVRGAPIADISITEWQFVLDVNLTGAMLCAQAFGRAMRERGAGAIVHTASICGSQPLAFAGSYSPSKSALLMFSRQLAAEWAPDCVRSNVVSPGLVRTPMTEETYRRPGFAEARAEAVPLGRVAGPAEMTGAIVFLASDRAAYITGQEITVDGGLSQTLMSTVPR